MIVGATAAAVPVPDSEMVDVGVWGSLLVMVMLPALLTAPVGEKVTFNVAFAPGAIVAGVLMPETPKGPPLTEIIEMARLEPPTLLTVTLPVAVVPTVTLPKFKLVGVTLTC